MMDYDYAAVMMTLAAVAYAAPEDIPFYLSPTAPPNATNGRWPVIWGPALTAFDKGNLMYISANASTGEYAIAIRGTYPRFSLAMLIDLYEDLDVSHPDAWKYPEVSGAAVAGGALDGLNDLVNLNWQSVSFHDFVSSEILKSGSPVYLTGHSLGGALVTVLAPLLAYQFSQSKKNNIITPYTFAAPTAGNGDFATWYTSQFANSYRYYNELDIVPRAWQQLSNIKTLYSSPGPACPREFKDAIELVNGWLDVLGVRYAQPNGSGSSLPGVAASTGDFFAEVLDQHDHNYYLQLLNAPSILVAAPGAAANSRAASCAVAES